MKKVNYKILLILSEVVVMKITNIKISLSNNSCMNPTTNHKTTKQHFPTLMNSTNIHILIIPINTMNPITILIHLIYYHLVIWLNVHYKYHLIIKYLAKLNNLLDSTLNWKKSPEMLQPSFSTTGKSILLWRKLPTVENIPSLESLGPYLTNAKKS
jgi:hypothetical protein